MTIFLAVVVARSPRLTNNDYEIDFQEQMPKRR